MVLTETISCDCGADVVQLSGDVLEAEAETRAFIAAHQAADDQACHIHLDIMMGSERGQRPEPSRR